MINKNTTELYDEVLAALTDPALPQEKREELYRELAEVEMEINRARKKTVAQEIDNVLSEWPQDEPKCSCGRADCRLKRGVVPPVILDKSYSGNLEMKEEAEEYLIEHDGGEAVRDALDRITDREAEIRSDLRIILSKANEYAS